ncbi:MAG: TonB-dependent receptor [Blastocatellia bacterium]|nr:TonB-dependent receptor [Blastocatellia bacterium]
MRRIIDPGRVSIKVLAFINACFLLTELTHAQTTISGRLKGKVCYKNKDSCTEVKCEAIHQATIKIVSQTGLQRSLLTDNQGEYDFNFLPSGNYTITVQCESCTEIGKTSAWIPNNNIENIVPPPIICLKKKEGSTRGTEDAADIKATEAYISNIPSLSIKGPSTIIVFSEQAGPQSPIIISYLPASKLVRTSDGSAGGNIAEGNLQALPLPGIRTIESLAALFPGISPPPRAKNNTVGPGIGAGIGTSGQFSINGLRSRANNFTIDGSDNNDEDVGVRRQGFTTLLPQSVESVQGFHITTLLPTSQFGRNLGGQINLVSRYGSPRYTGTVYGFFTNDRLKARDFFNLTGGPATFPLTRASDGAPVLFNNLPLAPTNPVRGEDQFMRRQAGFVLGGPIGRQASKQSSDEKKTLFFLSYENQKIAAGRETHFAVPTVAERGIFGSGDGSRPAGFPSNLASLFPSSVTGNAIFSLFPFPNNPRGPYGKKTFTEILPANAQGNVFSLRVDRAFETTTQENSVTLHNGQTLGGRYNFTDDQTDIPATGEALFSSIRALVRTQNASFFYNAAFSPNLVNEIRSSYGRTSLNFLEVRNSFLQPSLRLPREPFLLNANLISNSTTAKSCNGQPCFSSTPGLTIEEILDGPMGEVHVSGYSPIGVDVYNFPQSRANNTIQVADTLFYNQQRNRITLGFDLRRIQLNSRLDRNFRSLAVFNGALDIASAFGRSNFSPNGFYTGADFVAAGAPTGFLQTYAQEPPDSRIGLRYWQRDVFGADEIRIRSNLTLTLGVRYQYTTVPNEVNQRIEKTFDSSQVAELIDVERRQFGASGFERFLAGRTKIYAADRNNVAPHLAIAWDPFGKATTSIRGGYGIYYDQIPGAVISQSRSVFPSFLSINLAGLVNPTIPQSTNFFAFNPAFLAKGLNTYDKARFGDSLVAFLLYLNSFAAPIPPNRTPQTFPGGAGFVLPAADLSTPYSQHWGLTVEREIQRDFLLSVGYVGTRGVHLLRFATPNLGPNVIPIVTGVGAGPGGTTTVFQGFTVAPGQGYKRPFPLLGSLTSIESDASSTYHSLQIGFSNRLGKGVQFTTAYTWSHAIDEVSDLFDLGSGPVLPQNSFDRRQERASASFDIRHNFVYSLVWDLPFASKNRLLGGWRIASIGTFRTGQPFTLLSGVDVNLDGNLTDRVNTINGLQQLNKGPVRFSLPDNQLGLLAGAGSDGAVGRNTLRAPGTATIDLAIGKIFKFKDRHKFEFKAEIFNLFNRTHFGIPVHQLQFPSLGQSVDTRLPARTIQLVGKYSF